VTRGVQLLLGIFGVVVGAAVVVALVVGPQAKGGGEKGDKATGLQIESVEGQQVTFRDVTGSLLSGQVDTKTVIKRGDQVIALADLRPGDPVEVRPRPGASGQTRLDRITIKPPRDGG